MTRQIMGKFYHLAAPRQSILRLRWGQSGINLWPDIAGMVAAMTESELDVLG
jgi:hypothetical protein